MAARVPFSRSGGRGNPTAGRFFFWGKEGLGHPSFLGKATDSPLGIHVREIKISFKKGVKDAINPIMTI